MNVLIQQAPASSGGGSSFASGTKMLFVQTAAPTGWTKQTDQNDKALRIISGTVGTGGTSAFSTVFGKTATDAHTLTSAQMPSHTHDFNAGGGSTSSGPGSRVAPSGNAVSGQQTTLSAGGGGSHTHGMDIRVQYVDVIYATKD